MNTLSNRGQAAQKPPVPIFANSLVAFFFAIRQSLGGRHSYAMATFGSKELSNRH